jgi:hypothetical protein
MISATELIMNQKAIMEINAIRENVLLSFQVLLIIGLLDKGMFPAVKISIKDNSNLEGDIYMCSGHSFLLTSLNGYIGNISFSDIDYLEIMPEACHG